jgi:hypothetical protein
LFSAWNNATAVFQNLASTYWNLTLKYSFVFSVQQCDSGVLEPGEHVLEPNTIFFYSSVQQCDSGVPEPGEHLLELDAER